MVRVRYLLDTDTVSALTRRRPSEALLLRMATTAREDRTTSSITLSELLFGAHKAGARSTELVTRIRAALPRSPLIPFDDAAAEEYGRLRAHLEAQGTPIGQADTQIAAIALANDLTVVTGNVRHFERVPGLTVENWLA
ncbi:MAG: type II toxin-antitoxin system VapC family toxin [Chloroflexi bacterium]|nr:type II toxin-antitoxin system VapC family toxin [Chloroflexota bacterium]